MQYDKITSYQMKGFPINRKRSQLIKNIYRLLDVLQHLVLLAVFLLFLSFIQVATAYQPVQGDSQSGSFAVKLDNIDRTGHDK